jgi:hypothetical protein
MIKTTKKVNVQKQPAKKVTNDIILCWCDNGQVDGKFAEGIVYTLLTSNAPLASAMRVQGNQIGRQRQNALDHWYDNSDFEWILWVDSDIVLTAEVIDKMWSVADKNKAPVVSGLYFISKEMERSVMAPFPAAFNFTENEYQIQYIHPLPINSVVKADAAGFGLLLMHRSVVTKMREVHGKVPFFNETGVGEEFVSEDINFFRHMKAANVPLHVHTGALVKHMKRFALDVEYYKLYWNNQPNGN